MTPYPYQSDILAAVDAGWAEFDRQLVVSPTGSGKTAMFSWLAQKCVEAGGKVLILVDQDELVWQALDKLKAFTGILGAAEKAEFHADSLAPVVVATVQSMVNRLGNWPADHFALVIADEADKSISPQWQAVLNHFDAHARVCGFTATPHRTDQRNLGCYYQNCIELENLFSLVEKGFLSPVVVHQAPIRLDLSGASIANGDYDPGDLDAIIGPHLLEIAREIREHAGMRKTLVFLPLVKTAQKFAEIARGAGLLAEYVHGKDPERAGKLSAFANGEFDVLANSSLLTRGYDDTSIDCIVPCRPTKSVTLFFQMVGRGTRTSASTGKRDMLLFDFLYQAHKHLVCRPAHLIAKNDVQAQVITELEEERAKERAGMPSDVADQMPLDLRDLASDATAQREEALRRQLEAHKGKKRKTIPADEFAYVHGNSDLADYEPAMPWESAAISERQEKYLKQAKIDLSTVRGRGHASKLLDIVFANKGPRSAAPKAIALMKRMAGLCHEIGIHEIGGATAAQAGRFFKALKERRQNPELI